ncbi:hypothetical protein PBI_SUZY_94 [Gordonia phage Suzy]|uniref:Uncharacterized protein n=1 Tax=Gordonia phage Suzy TaxID=2201430 RepID=A0A2Z4Q9Q1_9CAUD|nr:hypothetical protein HOT44_gp94 [Gordonia phage Suzy]AWY06198.1 hypothetical protein PBI_SUZY_94 [Gordonia phage Suzy]
MKWRRVRRGDLGAPPPVAGPPEGYDSWRTFLMQAPREEVQARLEQSKREANLYVSLSHENKLREQGLI